MGLTLPPADARAWLALATAVGCFAATSAVSIGRSGPAAPAATTALAVGGAIPAGLWAVRMRRRTHALVALGLWGVVLLAGGLTVTAGPLDWPAGITGFTVALWTSALTAGVTTVYLGCREFGSPARVTTGDDRRDGDPFSR